MCVSPDTLYLSCAGDKPIGKKRKKGGLSATMSKYSIKDSSSPTTCSDLE